MAIANLTDYLKSIADSIRTKKGTTAPINAQNFASEISSIEGGGEGSATLKGGWTGTAVPVDSTTTIEKIYLNKALSNEEVVNLLETNISLSPIYSPEEPVGCIFTSATDGVFLVIMIVNGLVAITNNNNEYIYFVYDTTGAGKDIEIAGFSGWSPVFGDTITINETQNPMDSDYLSADLNEALKSLFSITPFEKIDISLSGTYEGKELVITENRTYDLSNSITNNKEIITSVKSDVLDYQKIISITKGVPSLFTSSFINENWILKNKNFLEQYMQMVVNADYSAVNYFIESFKNLFLDYNVVGIEINIPTKIKINNDNTTDEYTSFDHTFENCFMLKTIDINYINNVARLYSVFLGCSSLTTLIIRNIGSRGVPKYDGTLSGCAHFEGNFDEKYNPNSLKDGKIYVPDDYVNSFKTEDGWSNFADLIYPLSEYVE